MQKKELRYFELFMDKQKADEDAGKDFVKSWSVYIKPKAIFTFGHEV